MIDGEDEFFGPVEIPEAEKVGGLVVGQRARQIFERLPNGKQGACLFDELPLLEMDWIRDRDSRPIVTFDDDIERASRAPV